MSKAKKKCKFVWITSSTTNEVLTPYRLNGEIGSLGGRVIRRIPNHNPLTSGNLKIANIIKTKEQSIVPLAINETEKSKIFSYQLDVTPEELLKIAQQLNELNEEKERKTFSSFKIRNYKELPFDEMEKYCGTAKEELLELQNKLTGECK